jgi:hypothetical protein
MYTCTVISHEQRPARRDAKRTLLLHVQEQVDGGKAPGQGSRSHGKLHDGLQCCGTHKESNERGTRTKTKDLSCKQMLCVHLMEMLWAR